MRDNFFVCSRLAPLTPRIRLPKLLPRACPRACPRTCPPDAMVSCSSVATISSKLLGRLLTSASQHRSINACTNHTEDRHTKVSARRLPANSETETRRSYLDAVGHFHAILLEVHRRAHAIDDVRLQLPLCTDLECTGLNLTQVRCAAREALPYQEPEAEMKYKRSYLLRCV